MKIIHSKELKVTATSYNKDVYKRTLIGNGEIPHSLSTFGVTYLTPGQAATEHFHVGMYEIFYIIKGKVDFFVNDEKVTLNETDSIVIEPRERHFQANNYEKDVEWVYFRVLG